MTRDVQMASAMAIRAGGVKCALLTPIAVEYKVLLVETEETVFCAWQFRTASAFSKLNITISVQSSSGHIRAHHAQKYSPDPLPPGSLWTDG